MRTVTAAGTTTTATPAAAPKRGTVGHAIAQQEKAAAKRTRKPAAPAAPVQVAERLHKRPVANAACKKWAIANGFTLSASGHLRKNAIDAYLEAHPQVGVSASAKLVMPAAQ